MAPNFDVIVVGVGGMGSATCYQLARQGVKVLGLEQFEIGHALGSSHGESRLIRQAYFEAADYVPLLKRSYELWEALETRAKRSLFRKNGLIIMGPQKGGTVLPGVLKSAVAHGIELEILNQKKLRQRYPQFTPPEGYQGYLEKNAGFLEVEKCVREFARIARMYGATLNEQEPLQSWTATNKGVTVKTAKGTYQAGKLIFTAGPWSAPLLKGLGISLSVRRVAQFWFSAPPVYDYTAGCPCFAFDGPDSFVYGFPQFGKNGLKLADHSPGDLVVKPEAVDRHIYPQDIALLQRTIARCLPGVLPNPKKSAVCLYTLSNDENFIIDFHPEFSSVIFAAGFSGHGFKFASVIGEILADLALLGQTKLPINFLRLRPKIYAPNPAP